MNISGIIYTLLAGDTTVTGLVGTDSGGGYKIYPLTIPQQAALPAVRIIEVAVEPSDTKTQASGMDAVRVQIDCYSKSMLVCQQLEEAVRQAIDRYRGEVTVAGTGGATYFVDGIRFENRNQTMEDEKDIFRASTDYQVRVKRSFNNFILDDATGQVITTAAGIPITTD
jgi:hypothetical protein